MYQRISKQKAHHMYAIGQTFYMCACNMHPESWSCKIDRWDSALDDEPFEALVNEFRYYNCNPETGNHVSFYEKSRKRARA